MTEETRQKERMGAKGEVTASVAAPTARQEHLELLHRAGSSEAHVLLTENNNTGVQRLSLLREQCLVHPHVLLWLLY